MANAILVSTPDATICIESKEEYTVAVHNNVNGEDEFFRTGGIVLEDLWDEGYGIGFEGHDGFIISRDDAKKIHEMLDSTSNICIFRVW